MFLKMQNLLQNAVKKARDNSFPLVTSPSISNYSEISEKNFTLDLLSVTVCLISSMFCCRLQTLLGYLKQHNIIILKLNNFLRCSYLK